MGLEQFSLDGQLALVTGSSRGIGLAIARALGEAGATLVLNASTDSRLEASSDALRKEGLDSHYRYFDVTNETAVAESVDDIERTIGPITILVNNAGILRDKSFKKMDMGDWDLVMAVHLNGTGYVTKAAWPIMYEKNYGRIVFTSSTSGI